MVETAIEQVSYGVPAATGDADSAVAVRSAIAGAVRSNVVRYRDDSGLSERQIQGVAAVERQTLNGRAGNGGSESGVDCLHLRGFRSDLNGFHDRSRFQV